MATHSSILAWRIPWTEEPDGLQSMESQRVGHDRATNTVFEGNVNPLQYSWPGKSHGQRNLAGCSPWGSQRVGYDLVTNGPWVGKIPWRMEWLPTPVFLPEEFHEQRSLTGCSPWSHKELDTTKQLSTQGHVVRKK